MKNITIAFLVALIAGMGCTEDFLEKTPNDSLDPSKIDAAQMDNLRNSLYSQIPGSEIVFYDGYADNGYSRNWWDSNGSLVQSNTVSSSENFGYGDWQHNGDNSNYYTFIRACNQMITTINDYTQIDEKLRQLYHAEARLMRAWHYLNLTLFYGDVALVKEVKDDFGEGLPRDPASTVREWILQELEDAFQVLPVASEDGRFNKAMAYALKARAAYYFGNYEVAGNAARYVIDNGGYELYSIGELDEKMKKDAGFFRTLIDFDALDIDEEAFVKGIFSYQNLWDVDNNPEVIIAKEYMASEEYGDFNRVTSFMTPNLSGKEAWGTIVPIQDLVDSYWSADGKTKPTLDDMQERVDNYNKLMEEISVLQSGPDGKPETVEDNLTFSQAVQMIIEDIPQKAYMKQYLNRDSRLYASISFPFAASNKFIDGLFYEYKPNVDNYGKSGFAFRKLASANDVLSVWDDWYYMSGLDFPVIRLAEMILIYAEAQTQIATYDASVTAELNRLRIRCGMPDVPVSLGKEEALDFIRRERRIELAGEGLRYFDIRLYEDPERNGGFKGEQAASVVMQGQTLDPVGNNSAYKEWASRLMYMPLPASTIDKNPALKNDQNTGY